MICTFDIDAQFWLTSLLTDLTVSLNYLIVEEVSKTKLLQLEIS